MSTTSTTNQLNPIESSQSDSLSTDSAAKSALVVQNPALQLSMTNQIHKRRHDISPDLNFQQSSLRARRDSARAHLHGLTQGVRVIRVVREPGCENGKVNISVVFSKPPGTCDFDMQKLTDFKIALP